MLSSKIYLLILVAILLLKASAASIIFYSVPDGRHLSPMKIIAETYSELHKESHVLFLFYNGSLFNYSNKQYTLIEEFPKTNVSSTNIWLNYVPGIKNIFGGIHAQYTLVDQVIKKQKAKLLVVDILCAGGILAAVNNGLDVIRNSPYPYVDPAQDAVFMPSYFSQTQIGAPILISVTELVVRKFQSLLMNAFFWAEFGEYNIFNHPTLVNSIIGIEVARNIPPYVFFTGPILPPSEQFNGFEDFKDYILIDFGPFSTRKVVGDFFESIERCQDGLNFMVLSAKRSNSSCVLYSNSLYQNVINSTQIHASILVAEHIKVHTSLILNKPSMVVSFIKEHMELLKRLSWSKACLTTDSNNLLLVDLKNLVSAEQKNITLYFHNLLVTWGADGNIKAAEIIHAIHKFSCNHFITLENALPLILFYTDYSLLLGLLLFFFFFKYCKKLMKNAIT